MLSLIEVQCPHCSARGQIMVPPLGAIIIGPCPQCQELVAVFCGQVLALDKEIMTGGDFDEKRDHLLEVLTEFLKDRLTRLLSEEQPAEEGGEAAAPKDLERLIEESHTEPSGLITQVEFERFTQVDLKLLDNDAYFRSVFDKK